MDKKYEVYYDTPILISDVLKDNNIAFPLVCGGNHTCGKCKVKIKGAVSEIGDAERLLLGDSPEGVRLACFAKALGDCTVYLNFNKSKILTDFKAQKNDLLPLGENYGFAVDIGTTTVAVYLYDLKNGNLLKSCAFLNPQQTFGADVISRITASHFENKKNELSISIVSALQDSMLRLCKDCGVDKHSVDAAVITGNTAMLYLLLKRDVKGLAFAPFEIEDHLGYTLNATELGFKGFNFNVLLPRVISSFVGADITCAAINTLANTSNETVLLIDIGTNGEMVLKDKRNIFVCSTAAGPAFEGVGIKMGMPAKSGAISKVYTKNNKICFETVENTAPKGICGSGLIDAVSVFLNLGYIDETGLIDNMLSSDCLTMLDGEFALKIGDSGILLCQSDIRNLQLAKSAIRAGIETLLNTLNISVSGLSRLIIAGGMGSSINTKSAQNIGLIPNIEKEKVYFAGNAAAGGAVTLLLNKEQVQFSQEFAKSVKALELANSEIFMEKYIENMMF